MLVWLVLVVVLVGMVYVLFTTPIPSGAEVPNYASTPVRR